MELIKAKQIQVEEGSNNPAGTLQGLIESGEIGGGGGGVDTPLPGLVGFAEYPAMDVALSLINRALRKQSSAFKIDTKEGEIGIGRLNCMTPMLEEFFYTLDYSIEDFASAIYTFSDKFHPFYLPGSESSAYGATLAVLPGEFFGGTGGAGLLANNWAPLGSSQPLLESAVLLPSLTGQLVFKRIDDTIRVILPAGTVDESQNPVEYLDLLVVPSETENLFHAFGAQAIPDEFLEMVPGALPGNAELSLGLSDSLQTVSGSQVFFDESSMLVDSSAVEVSPIYELLVQGQVSLEKNPVTGALTLSVDAPSKTGEGASGIWPITSHSTLSAVHANSMSCIAPRESSPISRMAGAVVSSLVCIAPTAQGAIISSNDIASSSMGATVLSSTQATLAGQYSVVAASRKIQTSSLEDTKSLVMGWEDAGQPGPSNRKIRLRSTDGTGVFAGSVTSDGFDYAEYFENKDKGVIPAGTVVSLDGEKIVPACEGSDILGVVSATSSVIGNKASFCWNGRWLKNEFGEFLLESKDFVVDDKGSETLLEEYEGSTDGMTIISKDVRVQNPDYSPSSEYTERSSRKDEWTVVGLLGQLFVKVYEDISSKYVSACGKNSSEETRLLFMKQTMPFDENKGYGVVLCLLR